MIQIPALADFSSHKIEGYLEQTREQFAVNLFTQIDGNLWMGGCPVESLPREFAFVVDLYGHGEYHVTRDQIRTDAPLLDTAGLPELRRLHALARHVNECRAIAPTLVHCQAGLNRSGLVTGLALVLSGWTAGASIALMREKRCEQVLCNKHFERWLRQQMPPAAVVEGLPA